MRICRLDPEITTRTKYEIDEIDDTKKFDPLAREIITPRILQLPQSY